MRKREETVGDVSSGAPSARSLSARTPTWGVPSAFRPGNTLPSSIAVSSHQNPDALSQACFEAFEGARDVAATGRVDSVEGQRGGSARGWRTATRRRSGRIGSGRVEPETRPCGVLTRRAETRRGGSIKHITESARSKSETSSDASPTKNTSKNISSALSSPFTPSQVAIPPSRVAKETRDGGYSRRCVSRRRARPARPGLGRAPAAWG